MSSDDEICEILESVPDFWYLHDYMKFCVKIKDGRLACPECADVQEGSFVEGHHGSTKIKKKSEHSRVAWMRRKLSGLTKDSPNPIVENEFVDSLAHDFALVEKTMRDKGLIKGRNMSRHDYYIIPLCSRIGTKQLVERKDLQAGGKARARFEDDLYGVIYPELGWCDDNDGYYREWRLRTGQDPV